VEFSLPLPAAASDPLVVSIIFKSSIKLLNLFHYKIFLHYYISKFYLPQAGRLRQQWVVFTDSNAFFEMLKNHNKLNTVLLLMSSGNFDGVNLNEFSENWIND